jgi:hypothetical protein
MLWVNEAISRIVHWMFGAIGIHWWRWNIEASAPGQGLLGTMLFRGGLLVEALEGPIVTLIPFPVAFHRKPHLAHLIEGQVTGHASAR